MQNFKVRLSRYIGAWLWIVGCNAKLFPHLLYRTIFYGVTARLSTIAGFVLSIKSAILIFQPHTIPQALYSIFPVSENTMFGLLIIFPGSVFLLTGFLRYFHSKNLLELKTGFSNHFAQEIGACELKQKTIEELSIRKNFSLVANSLKQNHTKFYSIEGLLLELLVLTPVIVISLAVGLFIQWKVVTTVIVLGVFLGAVVIWKRHMDTNQLNNMEAALQNQQADSVRQFVESYNTSKEKTENKVLELDVSPQLSSMAESISNLKNEKQKFKSTSDLAMDTVQSVIVIIFLSMLLLTDIKNMEVQNLVVLALLFRFIISYGKAIVQVILKLSPFYKFMVETQTLQLKNNVS